MRFKMSEKSLFAVLLRSHWAFSFGLAAMLGMVGYTLMPEQMRIAGALAGFPFIVIGVIAFWRQLWAPKPEHVQATLEQLSSMGAKEFLQVLERSYQADGYQCAPVAHEGADLLIRKAGQTTVVSAKRWKAAAHGLQPMQQLHAAVQRSGADRGVYVAIHPVSPAAQQWATDNGLAVFGGEELAVKVRATVLLAQAAR